MTPNMINGGKKRLCQRGPKKCRVDMGSDFSTDVVRSTGTDKERGRLGEHSKKNEKEGCESMGNGKG